MNSGEDGMMKEKRECFMEMMKKIGITFSDDEIDAILQKIDILSFSKSSFIVQEGSTLSGVYIIIKGLSRGFYSDENGNESIRCFSSEGDFICTEGLRNRKTATFSIQALEDMKCIFISYDLLLCIMERDESAFRKYNEYNCMAIGYYEERQHGLLTKTAGERYKDFLKIYSGIEKRINQEYIASYIGIRPSSLSRLKRNLKN